MISLTHHNINIVGVSNITAKACSALSTNPENMKLTVSNIPFSLIIMEEIGIQSIQYKSVV